MPRVFDWFLFGHMNDQNSIFRLMQLTFRPQKRDKQVELEGIPRTCSKQNLNFIKVDSTKVENLLKHLYIHKSTAPDGIGNLLLRNCSISITKSVTFLYQTIMHKGTYPTYWKVSQISPIFKDGNKSDVTCYRTISLLNCMSKVLEKIYFDTDVRSNAILKPQFLVCHFGAKKIK